jgi:hypothetical protein
MRRPCRGCRQIALNVAIRHWDIDVRTARQSHFRGAGRIGAALTTFEHTRRGQQLCAVANGGDRFAGLVEGAHQVEDCFVEAQVFRRTAARDQQRVIVGLATLAKSKLRANR